MVKQTVVIDVCDLCEAEQDVKSLVLSVDRKAPVKVDLCDKCRGPRKQLLSELTKAGRPVRTRRRREENAA